MKKLNAFVAAAFLSGAAALSMQPASAWWGGPGYGSSLGGVFGDVDFSAHGGGRGWGRGYAYDYPYWWGYPGYWGGPWGYPGYWGGPWGAPYGGYGPYAPVAPATSSEK